MKGIRGIGNYQNVDPYYLVETLLRIEVKLDILGIKEFDSKINWDRSVDIVLQGRLKEYRGEK